MAPRALDALMAASRAPQAREAAMTLAPAPWPPGHTLTDAGIAVVPIIGPLVARGDRLTALFGATSYDAIAATIEPVLADPSARAVLLELDSPGGEVGGLFDLVDRLAALRDAARKPLWAA